MARPRKSDAIGRLIGPCTDTRSTDARAEPAVVSTKRGQQHQGAEHPQTATLRPLGRQARESSAGAESRGPVSYSLAHGRTSHRRQIAPGDARGQHHRRGAVAVNGQRCLRPRGPSARPVQPLDRPLGARRGRQAHRRSGAGAGDHPVRSGAGAERRRHRDGRRRGAPARARAAHRQHQDRAAELGRAARRGGVHDPGRPAGRPHQAGADAVDQHRAVERRVAVQRVRRQLLRACCSRGWRSAP